MRLLSVILRFTLLAGALLLHPVASHAAQPWKNLTDCHLLPNRANDGDSFHVQHKGKEYIFRLYFVDCPETDNSFPDRVSEQADYFHITHAQAITIGKAATRFTAEKLHDPFTVITRMDDAMGRSHLPRYYAFILINSKQDLGELLVEHGLARIHGEHATKPTGTPAKVEVSLLKNLESRAKKNRAGAWAESAAAKKK